MNWILFKHTVLFSLKAEAVNMLAKIESHQPSNRIYERNDEQPNRKCHSISVHVVGGFNTLVFTLTSYYHNSYI